VLVGAVAVSWSAIAARDNSRAVRLFKRMAEANTDPDAFVAMLNERVRANDEDVLAKLRALIQADLESISSDVYEPIARLGHAYMREIEGERLRGIVQSGCGAET
jgi:hypothetical protein